MHHNSAAAADQMLASSMALIAISEDSQTSFDGYNHQSSSSLLSRNWGSNLSRTSNTSDLASLASFGDDDMATTSGASLSSLSPPPSPPAEPRRTARQHESNDALLDVWGYYVDSF